jgi:hypothetical protein
MKVHLNALAVLAGTALIATAGCSPPGGHLETIAEGVIYSVEYQMENGRTGGFTRLNMAQAVPGGNGSWNVDARGQLTREYLIVTRPQRKDLGPEIIPAHRLLNVQFGDGGIKHVNEGQPKPPS